MKTKSLSLDIETLVELTPEDQKDVNGGWKSLSSPMPTHIQPTPTAVGHHHHKKTVSSVRPMPTPPVHI